VIAINPEARTARIRLNSGTFQTLKLDTSTDQHLRHGYAQTAHAAQGRTADRVLIHADSKATNLVDQKMLYVAISRAKTLASVYINDKNKLITAIKERAGEKQVALTNVAAGISRASKSASAGL
jgi:ATP-dependent exoDNAse (exonuclease V) alpha subunit